MTGLTTDERLAVRCGLAVAREPPQVYAQGALWADQRAG